MLGAWLAALPAGSRPFVHIGALRATRELRRRLAATGVADADTYASHDFRRGHAQDLVDNVADLAQILLAGEWRTPSFLQYVNMPKLETRAVLEAHVDDSESDAEPADDG